MYKCPQPVFPKIHQQEPLIKLIKIETFYTPETVTDEHKARIAHWIRSYRSRIAKDGTSQAERRLRMNAVNPKYVLRNYMAQLATDKAETDDNSLVNELLDLLRRPYDEQPDKEEFAKERPEWARNRAGCSMLSCSSQLICSTSLSCSLKLARYLFSADSFIDYIHGMAQ